MNRNKKFWVKDASRLWDLCEETTEDSSFTLRSLSSGEVLSSCSRESMIPCEPSHLFDARDICLMNSLHEAPLIDLFRRKFEKDYIYSIIGQEDIVISINPYKIIPRNRNNFAAFNVDSSCNNASASSHEPHIFSTANIALKSLNRNSLNQSIIISGESGAGKTEASKMIFNFLIHCDTAKSADDASACEPVKKVFLHSNIIFESFGNSKTIRNDNSSRFGKFVKLYYSPDIRIISAVSETFLLEKSRLVHLSAGERNYHIFYMFLMSQAGNFGLTSVADFQILTQGRCLSRCSDGCFDEDRNAFSELLESFSVFEFSEEEIIGIWRLLAVILHLGNIQLSTPAEGSEVEIETVLVSLAQIAGWLGTEDFLLKNTLTSSRVVIANRSSLNVRILSQNDVNNNVKSLIKWIYNKLFEWLLKKMNAKSSNEGIADFSQARFIGVLDIFGFEILETNSLEQLCINYTNECLQLHFNHKIFVQEQALYVSEGVPWEYVSFSDNQSKIDLIAKASTGLLQQLEEFGSLNRKPDDLALLVQLNQSADKLKNDSYVKSRFKDSFFTIKHFAGDVVYDITGFISKNNFSLQEDLAQLMILTSDAFLSQVFNATPEILESVELAPAAKERKRINSSRRTGAVSLTSQFRQQVDQLMTVLGTTEPHYVTCIKPNNNKVPGEFDAHLVVDQLRHSGVMEVVRIRREGYPLRLEFNSFLGEYPLLRRTTEALLRTCKLDTESSLFSPKSLAVHLLQTYVLESSYCIGNEKIFLKTCAVEKLKVLTSQLSRFEGLTIPAMASRKICKLILSKILKRRHEMIVKADKIKVEAEEARRIEALAAEAEAFRLKEQEEAERVRLAEMQRLQTEAEQRQLAELAEQHRQAELAAEAKARIVLEKALFQFSRRRGLRNCLEMMNSTIKDTFYPSEKVLSAVQEKIPDILSILDRSNKFNSVLHTAAIAGNLSKFLTIPIVRSLLDISSFIDVNAMSESCLYLAVSSLQYTEVLECFRYYETSYHENTETEVHMQQFDQGHIASLNGNIVSAWISQSNDGTSWRECFHDLTPQAIVYFGDEDRTMNRKEMPLAGAQVVRMDNDPLVLQLTSPECQRSIFFLNKKGKDKFFRFQSEIDLQKLKIPLLAVLNKLDESKIAQDSTSASELSQLYMRSKEVKKIRHKALTGALGTDREGNTTLHVVASVSNSEAYDSALMIACWLIHNGADIASANKKGETPAELAAKNGNFPLISLLVFKGGLCDSLHWPKILSHCTESLKAKLKAMHKKIFISVAPPYYGGLTYIAISVLFQRSQFDSSKRVPWLTISVFNPRIENVEQPFIIPSPAAFSSQVIYWCHDWYMQTPLESLEPDSYIVIESSFVDLIDGTEVLKKFIINLNRESIAHGHQRLPHELALLDALEVEVFVTV